MLAFLTWASLALGLTPIPPVHTDNRAQAGPEVAVKRDEILRANVYTGTDGDCRIEWTVFGSEANRGVVRHRSDCSRPLGEQAPLIGRILKKVLESEDAGWEFRTLSWGRVFGDGERDATMAVRLAVAARKSPAWDAAAGRARQGDINGLVGRIFREAGIADELKRVFSIAGLRLEVSSVEKVLVQKAGAAQFWSDLSKRGVLAADKVPFDCQLWFSVQRGTQTK